MKHILLLIAIVFASLGAKAQSIIDTNVKCATAVKIRPVKVRYNDTMDAKWLAVKVIDDNLVSKRVLYFALLGDGCTVLLDGNAVMTGDLRKDCDDIDCVFGFTAQKIQVTLKP